MLMKCGECRSTTEVAGVGMESSLLRFARQHLQAACALPTGTYPTCCQLSATTTFLAARQVESRATPLCLLCSALSVAV